MVLVHYSTWLTDFLSWSLVSLVVQLLCNSVHSSLVIFSNVLKTLTWSFIWFHWLLFQLLCSSVHSSLVIFSNVLKTLTCCFNCFAIQFIGLVVSLSLSCSLNDLPLSSVDLVIDLCNGVMLTSSCQPVVLVFVSFGFI